MRHYGGTYPTESLGSIASKLISSLFYVELDRMPTFYVSPEMCTLVVLCRVLPGDGLLDLLNKLRRGSTRIAWQGSEIKHSDALLCTDEVMIRCQDLQYFARTITVKVSSLETQIAVQIGGTKRPLQSISNCPYRLRDLIKDQGLDSAFDSRSRRALNTRYREEQRSHSCCLVTEVDRLVKTIRLIT